MVLLLEADKSPVEEWLDDIRDKTTLAKIVFQIDKLSRNLGFTKNVKGICELKIDIGPGYRVYYVIHDAETLVVLIGGGSKKMQTKDIQEAQRLWASFVEEGRPETALREWRRDIKPDQNQRGEQDETEEL